MNTQLNINFTESLADCEAVIVLINNELKLDDYASLIDEKYDNIITKTLKSSSIFEEKYPEFKTISTISTEGKLVYILLMGIGKKDKPNEYCYEKIGGRIFYELSTLKVTNACIMARGNNSNITTDTIASLIANGALLASYKFDKYFTKIKEENKTKLINLTVITNESEKAEKLFHTKKLIAEAIFLARDCVTEPGNILYPASYADIIHTELNHLPNTSVEILGEREMRNLGMGALLGVAQGSQNEAKLVIMQYNGLETNASPIVALVGKGVTFDTGGISLKPSTNMAAMKYDMAGSAAVLGTIKALALRKAKVNVVGVVGLVENMPGSNAQRPGDVVTTMSKQTAEVIDTDAEGRLVLADAIWYTQTQFKPSIVIDLATLTGAIVVALGNTYAGLFSNDDELSSKLIKAGDKVDEKLWRMPLHKDYDEMIKSDIADVANLGNVRGAAGSSTAAHFIQHFVLEDTKWAHLDIAGMAWNKTKSSLNPKGATGFGVRLLNQFIFDNYESK